MKFIFAALLSLSWSQVAFAYVLPYWMIMSRTAENHGSGVYRIDQEVVFQHGTEPIILNERWYIQGENSMRLEVTGRRQMENAVRLTYIYNDGYKYYIDENGVKRTEKVPPNFFEPYFHFRYSKNIKAQMVALDMVPASSLKSAPTKYVPEKPKPLEKLKNADKPKTPDQRKIERDSYVRLSRAGGVIAYAIGSPTPASGSQLYPGLWIEQDQFNLRKLRLPSQLEVSANNYKKFGNKLSLPTEMIVTWPQNQAKISVGPVEPMSMSTHMRELLNPAELNYGKDQKLARQLPEDKVIKEFYTLVR